MFRRRAIEGSAPFPALVDGVVVARGNEQGENGKVRSNLRADTYRARIRARCLRDAEGPVDCRRASLFRAILSMFVPDNEGRRSSSSDSAEGRTQRVGAASASSRTRRSQITRPVA